MSRASANTVSIGIDFGTTNTVVALARPGGEVEAVRFAHDTMPGAIFMTALCFWDERINGALTTRLEGGPWAIDAFLEGGRPHRFIQSFKSFAGSGAFQETRIFRERFKFEDLLAAFMRTLVKHAGGALDFESPRIVIGRPVKFAGNRPDEALAMQRYRAAFSKLGADNAIYVHEPVGAAFSFARRLTSDATVLVADFGGGTSDFSVLQFEKSAGRTRATPLGSAGVGVAGDVFDYRLMDHIVSPKLGKGGSYRSFGKTLPLPTHYFANFARWSHLAMMKGSGELRELRELARFALQPEGLEDFIRIVEEDLGFALYRAVSKLKVELSDADAAEFRFHDGDIDIRAEVRRSQFERWIAADVQRIADTVDLALANARIDAAEIDQVFLTGGTSFVPAIRRLFRERFGAERLHDADHFESIAYGLALIGQGEDPGAWAAA
jgi:hypothetical chaperone protein